LIQGDLILTLGCARKDLSLLLLQDPLVNYGSANKCATARTDMRNGWNARNLSCEDVGQVQPRDTKVVGGGPDVHDFPMTECLTSSVHRAILRFDPQSIAQRSRTVSRLVSRSDEEALLCKHNGMSSGALQHSAVIWGLSQPP
jgi:hypothetical protein